ncbi:MAG: O-antigen ligase family protein [Alicyclobacillus sp.]|nr:O-antigen ligase family protein [Alicyclobacillus sp.]
MSLSERRYQVWSIVAVFGLTAFYILGLYNIGFFFTPVQTYAMSATALVGLLITIILGAWRTRMPWWLTFGFAYAVYIWLTTFWAANAGLAVAGAVVITGAVLVGLLGTVLPPWAKRYVLTILAIAGPVVYLFGVGTLFKWWTFNAAVVGGMMNSIFQYHNTFGAFELLSFTVCLGLLSLASSWWERALYLMCAGWAALGVISSYSREVWLLFPLVLLLNILVQWRRGCLGRSALHAIFAILVTLGASPFAILAMSKTSVHMVILMSIVVVGGSWALSLLDVGARRGLKKTSTRVLVFAIVGVIAIAAATVLIVHESNKLGTITQRLSSIQLKDFSVEQRLLFYMAAIRMWAATWHTMIFGSGWGTWTAKFLAYQQYPYQSTKVHSIVMNNLVNGGVVGFFLWTGIIVAAVVSGIRAMRRNDRHGALSVIALVAAIVMLLHAAFDFDFSYALMTVTFFLLLGVAAEPQEVRLVASSSRDEIPAPYAPVPPRVVMTTSMNLLMGASAIASVIMGGMLSVAEHMYWKATHTDVNTSTAARQDLQTAIKWAPYYADPYAALAQLDFTQYQQSSAQQQTTQQQSAQLLQEARTSAAKDPWNAQTQYVAASIAYRLGQLDQAYSWAQRASFDSPFHTQYTDAYMGMGLWTTVVQYKQNPQLAQERLREIVDELSFAEANVDRQHHMKFGYKPDWTYQVDAPMQAYAGAANYLLGKYQDSLSDVKNLSTVNQDPDTIGLVHIVTLLDNQHLHKGYKDPATLKEINSNSVLQQEYQDLLALRPMR